MTEEQKNFFKDGLSLGSKRTFDDIVELLSHGLIFPDVDIALQRVKKYGRQKGLI